ncbi:MAG: hypothetical protein JOZ83_14875 [Silvibacterium sp.]|nr:hypothetical protein [Silvibacterium sp.]
MNSPIIPIPKNLPRKFTAWDQAEQARQLARVHPGCIDIWQRGRAAGRTDTFIGLVELDTMTLFLAPCFGVRESALPRTQDKFAHTKMLARSEFPAHTVVIANSTSAKENVTTEHTRAELEDVYGEGNVCFVWLDPEHGGKFDGLSHKALHKWVTEKGWHAGLKDIKNWWYRSLGFAIQRDKVGYYIRFASTLNEFWGQINGATRTFEPRPVKLVGEKAIVTMYGLRKVPVLKDYSDREPRDLPRQWAVFIEQILARDLKLALHEGDFDRMVSRDEHQLTKFRRFEAAATDDRLV